MDVLISPIADLTSQPIILGAVFFMFLLAIILQSVLSKNSEKKWVQKILRNQNTTNTLSKEEIKSRIADMFIVFFITALSTFFFGLGIGTGHKLVKKIQNNTLSYDHKIQFESGKNEDVHLIDSNSSYFFYLSKGNKNIKIAPVGSIKYMELIHNKKLQPTK